MAAGAHVTATEVEAVEVSAFKVPTATAEESDGTLIWDSTSVVVVEGHGWNLPYFHEMLEAGAVDVLQADVTRCGGITNMLRVDGLCKARNLPFSAHCAPAVSAHVCCAMESVVHIEYFFDHYRIEGMLFEGTLDPGEGLLAPDRSRPGLGLELKRDEASRYAVGGG